MNKKFYQFIVVLISICLLVGPTGVLAQDNTPTDSLIPPSSLHSRISENNPSRPGFNPEKAAFHVRQRLAQSRNDPILNSPQATGGPDSYGYTWDDGLAISWIDARSLGSKSTLVGDDEFTGPIDIGFTFPFYENSYSQLYFNTNGLVTFGQGSPSYNYTNLPYDVPPNNLIAPFWSDLGVYTPPSRPDAGIYTYQGGVAPNRYYVIEWYRVDDYLGAEHWDLTFEVVLYENGDVLVQYLTLSGSRLRYSTTGIEDDPGFAGLKYTTTFSDPTTNKAIRFYRPVAAAARTKVWPSYQGQFGTAGQILSFPINIRNSGSLGADNYDLALPVLDYSLISFYRQDGTPLTDTDGDAIPETGSLNPGATLVVIARIRFPAVVNPGDSFLFTVIIHSTLDPSKWRSVYLTGAISTSFAQVYRESLDNALSLYTVSPLRQTLKKVTPDHSYPRGMAVVETPSRNLLTAWSVRRCLDNTCSIQGDEIEYSLVDHSGNTLKPLTKLVDHSGATLDTYNFDLAIAVTPDGRIGFLWVREYYNLSTNQYNDNVWFAILDNNGNLAYGPTNLTNNNQWGGWDDFNIPWFDSPAIAATGDNRFVLAWRELIDHGSGVGDHVSDLYKEVRGSDNSPVMGKTKITASTAYGPWYWQTNLSTLSGNRALLVYLIDYPNTNPHPVAYVVLNSDGTTFKTQTTLAQSVYPSSPDAVQLSGGNALVSWSSDNKILYALLDGASYNPSGGVTYLNNPVGYYGNDCASVTADNSGHGILTWSDGDSSHHLYYAAVGGNGAQLTYPMIFRNAHVDAYENQYISTSCSGNGNTSFTEQPTYPGIDTYLQAPAWVGASSNGVANILVTLGNHGLTTASQTVITATLDAALSYQGDTLGIPPTIDGHEISWHLPAGLGFLGQGLFQLSVGLPATRAAMPLETQYPVTLQIGSAGVEANLPDNSTTVMVSVSYQVFLPMTKR